MNSDTIIELVEKVEQSVNDLNEIIYAEKKRSVYAIQKFVRQSEFFQAQANGLKPDCVVVINAFEYNNEEFCYLEGKKFKIYRAFQIKNSERVELYLTDVVGENNVTT